MNGTKREKIAKLKELEKQLQKEVDKLCNWQQDFEEAEKQYKNALKTHEAAKRSWESAQKTWEKAMENLKDAARLDAKEAYVKAETRWETAKLKLREAKKIWRINKTRNRSGERWCNKAKRCLDKIQKKLKSE